MLLSLVLQLQPRAHAAIPADQGRALSAEFLGWVEARDPAFSAELHKENELRPYTVSGLRGGSQRGGQMLLLPGRPLWWRVTTLTPGLSQLVQEKIIPSLPQTLTLGEQVFDLTAAVLDPRQHPWAGQATYQQLAAGEMLSARRPARRIQVEFASPTTFHSDGRHQPFPLPRLVFRQWLEKWNKFSPVTLPQEVTAYAENYLVVSRYRLESQVVKFGQAMFIGFAGSCTYTILDEDPYWLRVLHTLADFSFYCGSGAKTTFGLGQTRLGRD